MKLERMAMGVAAAAVAGGLLAGCATTGYQKAERSAISLDNTQAEVQEAYAQVAAAVHSLDKIMEAQVGDLRPLYQTFVGEVKTLQAAAEAARNRALTMQTKNRDYFAAWAQEIEGIQNPATKAQSLQRYQQTLAGYQKVEQMLVKTRDAYVPLISSLGDLQKAMGQDLTRNGVTSLRAPYAKARQQGVELQGVMRNTVAAIQEAAKQMGTKASGG